MANKKSGAWSHERYQYNKYTFVQKAERIRKDTNLYDDVENFMVMHDKCLDSLVTKLLNNDFGHLRYSDPEHLF